jgi:hypothetical protein
LFAGDDHPNKPRLSHHSALETMIGINGLKMKDRLSHPIFADQQYLIALVIAAI